MKDCFYRLSVPKVGDLVYDIPIDNPLLILCVDYKQHQDKFLIKCFDLRSQRTNLFYCYPEGFPHHLISSPED